MGWRMTLLLSCFMRGGSNNTLIPLCSKWRRDPSLPFVPVSLSLCVFVFSVRTASTVILFVDSSPARKRVEHAAKEVGRARGTEREAHLRLSSGDPPCGAWPREPR